MVHQLKSCGGFLITRVEMKLKKDSFGSIDDIQPPRRIFCKTFLLARFRMRIMGDSVDEKNVEKEKNIKNMISSINVLENYITFWRHHVSSKGTKNNPMKAEFYSCSHALPNLPTTAVVSTIRFIF